jgi:hypothetical protein
MGLMFALLAGQDPYPSNFATEKNDAYGFYTSAQAINALPKKPLHGTSTSNIH